MTAAKKRENAKRWLIRKNLPHQVALPNDLCCMENYDLIAAFCRRFETEPMMQHVMAKWPNGKSEDFRLYCFATRAGMPRCSPPILRALISIQSRTARTGRSPAPGYEPTSGSLSRDAARWNCHGFSENTGGSRPHHIARETQPMHCGPIRARHARQL